MTFKLHFILFFISTLLFSSSFNQVEDHPIKLTSSQIKYDATAKTLKMECKVFIDDFAPVINTGLFLRARNGELTVDDKNGIERYFQEKYRIFVNHRKLSLTFKDYTIQENVMSIEFDENHVALKKGDEIYIENELLFEEFDYKQSNWMTIRIPPYVPNDNFESKIDNFTYSHRF